MLIFQAKIIANKHEKTHPLTTYSLFFVFRISLFDLQKKTLMARKQRQGGRPKGPNIFGVLKPYRSMITVLIVFALLSNAVNLVIPKIISHSIDDFSKGTFNMQTMLIEFLAPLS